MKYRYALSCLLSLVVSMGCSDEGSGEHVGESDAGSDTGSTALLVVEPLEVDSGDELGLNWHRSGVEGCVRRSEPAMEGWDGEPLPMASPHQIVATVGEGTVVEYELWFECDGQVESNKVMVTVDGTSEQPDGLSILDFEFNGEVPDTDEAFELVDGDDLTITWNTSEAATCTGDGDLPDWAGEEVTSGFTQDDLTAGNTYTAGLTCEADATDETASTAVFETTVEVDESTSCENARPEHWQQQLNCVHNDQDNPRCGNFEDLFGDWPGSTMGRQFFLDKDHYVALEITPDVLENMSTGMRRQINVTEPQFALSVGGTKLFTVSRCPGDFNRDRITNEMGSECFFMQSSQTAGFIYGGLESEGLFRCKFGAQPDGGSVYLNIVYTIDENLDDPESIEWLCAGTELEACGNSLSISGQGE